MTSKKSKTRETAAITTFIALSALLEFLSDVCPLRVPWGMSIDFVAVPVLIAFFALGLRCAILVCIGMLIALYLIMPIHFIGPIMKFLATLPMFLAPAIMSSLRGAPPHKLFKSPLWATLAAAAGIALRLAVVIPMNYYVAVPLFLGMSPNEIIKLPMFGGTLLGFIWFVASMNICQGVIDIGVSWSIAFKVGVVDLLRRYVKSSK